MKAKSGYETNGDYIKFKSGFTQFWVVETEKGCEYFKTEDEADMHIITKIIGCEKGFAQCKYWPKQFEGCNNCEHGYNTNCANSRTRNDKEPQMQ